MPGAPYLAFFCTPEAFGPCASASVDALMFPLCVPFLPGAETLTRAGMGNGILHIAESRGSIILADN